MKRKTVVLVSPSAYPLGGVASWLDELLSGLESRGWNAVLCLTKGRYHNPDAHLKEHPWHRVVAVDAPTTTREGGGTFLNLFN